LRSADRLLDWTRSLTVAVYFAVAHEPCTDDAAIWLLAPEVLNQHAAEPVDGICVLNGQLASAQIRPIVAAAFSEVECSTAPYAVLSQDLDVRVMIQSGAFTIHGDQSSLEEHAHAPEFLARFLIPYRARSRFTQELHAMGVRRSLLFPDLQHLAVELAGQFEAASTVVEPDAG